MMAASLVAKLWTKFRTKQAPPCIMIVGLDNSGKTSILNALASLNRDGNKQPTSGYQAVATSSSSRPGTPTGIGGTARGYDPEGNNIIPTIGYNYEQVRFKSSTLTVLDFSGQTRYRNLWQEFYNGADAIVFVIDSSDLIRLVVVRDELEIMLNHPYFLSLSFNSISATTATSEQQFHQAEALLASGHHLSALATVQKQITISQGKLIQSPLRDTTDSYCKQQNNPFLPATTTKRNNSSRRRTRVPILFLANKSDLVGSVDTQAIVKALNLNQLPIDRHPWLIQATSVNLNQGLVEAFDWLVNQLALN